MMVEDPLSLSGKRWKPRAQVEPWHQQVVADMGLAVHFGPIVASRGLDTREEVEGFLTPRLKQLADPLDILGMPEAVARLARAVMEAESIAIFGDYDVDGVTSSALLVRYFRALGRQVRPYIPNRLTEGYGPNPEAMKLLAEEGVQVVITVDCGIAAVEALEVAADLGLDVIVTDHHQALDELPKAVAIIDPNRPGDSFPHKELAGVGIAFYLTMALNRELRSQNWFGDNQPEPDLRTLLDLVAVGTIADIAPLTGLNRPLVAMGLKLAEQNANVGLNALIERAKVRMPLTAGSVGFHLGPRINAGGRLGDGGVGLELLSTENETLAQEIAEQLEAANRERRAIEDRILAEAMAWVEDEKLDESHRGLVLAREGWHPGVVGIVASRIAERFHRPTIVIALDEKGEGKGSGRSISGVDLLSAIQAAETHLIGFGGHRAAAGVTIAKENVDGFREVFDQALRENNPPEMFHPTLVVDTSLPPSQANRAVVEGLSRLHPFGRGNPEPIFILERVRVVASRALKDRHVKCRLLGAKGLNLDAIAFRILPGPLGEGLMQGGEMDVAGTLSINHFQGRETIQFNVKDARWSAPGSGKGGRRR
ncbi:MAG: single-stranded-DNA-specific exonuclease RecJ [Magnetococcales bacterium]|nr:single-stranded-DNA-specific exonuclease RecJ [Magnetococcales bacterium]